MANEPLSKKLMDAGDSMSNKGSELTHRITIPIILFILGCVTFPVGIIFWIIGLAVATGGAAKK